MGWSCFHQSYQIWTWFLRHYGPTTRSEWYPQRHPTSRAIFSRYGLCRVRFPTKLCKLKLFLVLQGQSDYGINWEWIHFVMDLMTFADTCKTIRVEVLQLRQFALMIHVGLGYAMRKDFLTEFWNKSNNTLYTCSFCPNVVPRKGELTDLFWIYCDKNYIGKHATTQVQTDSQYIFQCLRKPLMWPQTVTLSSNTKQLWTGYVFG